jgi:hypothetical protein
MKRTVGMVLVGICEICFGLFFLMMALLMVWMTIGKTPLPPNSAVPPKALFAVVGGMYGVFGSIAIATAIGVFMARNWARILTLVAGGMLSIFGAIGCFVMLIIPLPQTPNVTEQAMHWMRGLMAGFWLAIVLIGVWWLILFTRPRIVSVFKTSTGATASESSRPLSITIIGGVFLFSAIVGFGLQLVFHTPFVLFGHIIQGTTGVLINLGLAVAYGIFGVGLLRLDRRAYFGSLGVIGYGAMNALFMTLLPDRIERMQAILRANPGYDPNQFAGMSWMFSPWYSIFMCLVVLGIPAYFLITRRAAFYKAPQPEVPETLVV